MNIKPDDNKIKSTKSYPIPVNVKELQSFLAIINYLRKFIPNVAELTAPLRRSLEKNFVLQWSFE